MSGRLLLALFLISTAVHAFDPADFQICISESGLNSLLPVIFNGTRISDPSVSLRRDQFVLKVQIRIQSLPLELKFIGELSTCESGAVDLNINSCLHGLLSEEKDDTRRYLHYLIDAINSIPVGNPGRKISATFVDSAEYLATVRLSPSELALLPSLGKIRIQTAQLRERMLVISSSLKPVLNGRKDFQAFLGNGLLNKLLLKFTARQPPDSPQIIETRFNPGKKAGISFQFRNDPECAMLDLVLSLKVLKPDWFSLDSAVRKSDRPVDLNRRLSYITRILNHNIEILSTAEGNKTKFSVTGNRVYFNLSFDDLMPLKWAPEIYEADLEKDYLLLNAKYPE
ncbi:MAG: hypothetical protein PHW04_05230 [Candidatus Wallbacteria bacterium]|nr:hypothetical protein [Candidatus Wallbacteria bacterium]